MLSDIVYEPGSALLGGSADGAEGKVKSHKRKVTEERAVLHQKIIDEYWKRRAYDDDDAQWARNLIARKPGEIRPSADLALSDCSPLAVRSHAGSTKSIVDFSVVLQKSSTHQPAFPKTNALTDETPAAETSTVCIDDIEKNVNCNDAAAMSESLDRINQKIELTFAVDDQDKSWLKCMDNAPLELLRVDEPPKSEKTENDSVDTLVDDVLRNIESLIDESLATCIRNGQKAFTMHNADAARTAAEELETLQRLRASIQQATNRLNHGLPLDELSFRDKNSLAELPGLADTVKYLKLRTKANDATICDALDARDYARLTQLASNGHKLAQLTSLVSSLLPHSDHDFSVPRQSAESALSFCV